MNKKLLTIVLILALAALAFVNYTKRVQLASELKQMSVKMDQLQGGNTQQGEAEAKRIVERVKKLMVIQGDIEPTVASIIDVDTLRKKNEFYKVAENGDYLVVTPTRAILYSPSKNLILDVVPVQLQPATPAPDAGQAASSVPAQ